MWYFSYTLTDYARVTCVHLALPDSFSVSDISHSEAVSSNFISLCFQSYSYRFQTLISFVFNLFWIVFNLLYILLIQQHLILKLQRLFSASLKVSAPLLFYIHISPTRSGFIPTRYFTIRNTSHFWALANRSLSVSLFHISLLKLTNSPSSKLISFTV